MDYKADRISILEKVVIDGKDAESVIKYANRFCSDIEIELLETIRDGRNDEEIKMLYKVACRFKDRLVAIAEKGRQKEETLINLRRQ